MQPFRFDILDNLLKNKYKASVIDKWQFRDMLYGPNREDIATVSEMTENIITSDNAVFYLINDVAVINENCKCVYPYMYPSGKVLPKPLSEFLPYILFVAELSEDDRQVVRYARWGSFADNIFEEMDKLGLI